MNQKPSYEKLEKHIKLLEKKILNRETFENLVKTISGTLINMSVDEIDEGIASALKMLSEYIGAAKSDLFLFSNDFSTLTNAFTWSVNNDIVESKVSLKRNTLEYLWDQARRNHYLIVNTASEIPLSARTERKWFEDNQSRPIFLLPMILEKRIYGLLIFSGHQNVPLDWPEDVIVLIRLIVDRFTNALNRKKTELALINSKKISEALLNATTDSAMLLTTSGIVLAVNRSFSKRLGHSSNELIGKPIYNFILPEMKQQRKDQFLSVITTGDPLHFEDSTNGLEFRNIIYPVFGVHGNVERLAFYSHDITELKRAEKSIRFLTNELIKAQENERQKIACDLHDNVAQELASLRINCDALPEQIPGIPPEARKKLSTMSRTIKHSIDTVRDLAYELQPPSFDQMGLVKTLYRYCEEFTRKYGIHVDFYSAGLTDIGLSFDTENNIHRIVQEALNNVKAHSKAKQVIIRMVATYPNIILRIEDNGKGFDVDKTMAQSISNKRMGLKSIEGRTKLQNGKLKIVSRKNEGTRIFIEIPLEGNDLPGPATPGEDYYPLFKEPATDLNR